MRHNFGSFSRVPLWATDTTHHGACPKAHLPVGYGQAGLRAARYQLWPFNGPFIVTQKCPEILTFETTFIPPPFSPKFTFPWHHQAPISLAGFAQSDSWPIAFSASWRLWIPGNFSLYQWASLVHQNKRDLSIAEKTGGWDKTAIYNLNKMSKTGCPTCHGHYKTKQEFLAATGSSTNEFVCWSVRLSVSVC